VKRPTLLDRLLGRTSVKNSEDLTVEEREMIRGVQELSETTVKEVMVPRIDVLFLPIGLAEGELLERVTESGHSRIPIYADTIDNVVGVLYVKDLLNALVQKQGIDLEKLVRKPYFVPESKRIDTLLREFKRKRVHIAVAVDEYGGVSGIVCLEDIIEEIVGNIQDEFDDEREDIVKLGEGVYLCDARVDIEDLNEEIGSSLPDDGFDTLGGFVFDLFGKIPLKYEKVSSGSMDFIVQDMDGHKINSVKIIVKKEGGEAK
jgi:magnesium and cobalt transporter